MYMLFSISDEVKNCLTHQSQQVYQQISIYIRLPRIHSFLVLLFSRINVELQTTESKQGIHRLTKDKDLKRMEDENSKEKSRIIGTCARERWFLLNLKAKIASTCSYLYTKIGTYGHCMANLCVN